MTARIARIALLLVVALLAAANDPPPSPAQAAAPAAPAGQVPDRIGLTVTGNPASTAFVSAQIASAVEAAIRPSLAPGGTVRVTAILPAPQPLARGFLTGYTAEVSIDAGPGTAPVSGTTTVDVANADLPGFRPFALAFADDPERITADGVLSRTTIDVARPTRVYYYHENIGEQRRFCVVLTANDSVVTHVAIVDAAAGPSTDVMGVGHAVTKTFLTRQPRDEGNITSIAGGKPLVLRDTLVGAGDGVVGSVDLRVLDGGPVTVTVLAIPPAAQPADVLYAPKLPDDGHDRHGRFDLAGFANRVVAYTAGGRDATFEYGNRTQTLTNVAPGDPGHDYGDYGVVQRVTFDLDNPAGEAAMVYLYEKPLGGAVRSTFLVSGALIDIGCVRVPNHYFIAGYALAPHATGTLDVLTMTDGGSSYPLQIGVTTQAPLAEAPAIDAADGCFPKPGGPPAALQPAAGAPGR
jgi:hypothetical protein